MNAVQKYDKVQFNLPIAESLLYHPCPQLEGAEPELGADLEGERPDLDPQCDPGPEHPEDPGPNRICKWYCVCLVLVCVPYYQID